ncbi:MAG: hypothetical protein ACRD27_04660 [Terracidiphilus sp.]
MAPALFVGFVGVACHGQENKPCLSYAYPKGQSPGRDLRFDTAFDRLNVNGASFSCGPAIAASRARDALESFRYGVLYHDKARLNEVLQYPVSVGIHKTLGVEKPEVVIIHNADEWLTLQKERMTKIQIGVIACSWLGNVTVTAGYNSPGFFVGGGMVWFQRDGPNSAKVSVTAVNLMPLTPQMLASSCAP